MVGAPHTQGEGKEKDHHCSNSWVCGWVCLLLLYIVLPAKEPGRAGGVGRTRLLWRLFYEGWCGACGGEWVGGCGKEKHKEEEWGGVVAFRERAVPFTDDDPALSPHTERLFSRPPAPTHHTPTAHSTSNRHGGRKFCYRRCPGPPLPRAFVPLHQRPQRPPWGGHQPRRAAGHGRRLLPVPRGLGGRGRDGACLGRGHGPRGPLLHGHV